MAARLVRECAERGVRLCVAESCTGGMLSALITDVPGSSKPFWGGIVVYSNEAKTRFAGVKPKTLAAHGAVSAEAVSELLDGILLASPADLALAISGIAGPGGGSPEKPVGSVWIGCMRRGTAPSLSLYRFPGGRGAVRRRACRAGLKTLLGALRESFPGKP